MSGVGRPLPSGDDYCPTCFRSTRFGRCKRRDCEAHAGVYLRDQAQRLKANLASWTGQLTMVTLTGPGVEQLPWDASLCREKGPHKHSGPNGCRVNPHVAGAYNAAVFSNLSKLNAAAAERVRRTPGRGRVYVLGYVGQIKRGVFHLHIALGYLTAPDRAALDVFLAAYGELHQAYGFGREWDPGRPGRFSGRAATYIAKYLAPEHARDSFVPVLRHANMMNKPDPNTGKRPQIRPVYVSPLLSKQTGVTMRFLRFKRLAWVFWGYTEPQFVVDAYNLHKVFRARLEWVPECDRVPDPATAWLPSDDEPLELPFL